MARSFLIFVSDDMAATEKARQWAHIQGMDIKVFSSQQWAAGINNPEFRQQLQLDNVPELQPGARPVHNDHSNVLPFPLQNVSEAPSLTNNYGAGQRIATINEIESVAIENAIYEFNGNLTEAAKALGIGRATLYRKVKQYNIDPSLARKKRRVA